MQVKRSVTINASPSDVWSVVTNIEYSDTIISGIKKIEILENATGSSIVGLKWREYREWMGKEAVEVMWVTDASETSYYQTRAESHGAIYISRIELEAISTGTRLTMQFNGQPDTLAAKILWALTGWMARKLLRDTIDKDLADIKSAVER